MPTPLSLKATFYPGAYYHVVCKSIDGLYLFYNAIDYEIFNQRFIKFTGNFIDVWSFCLLPNHSNHIIKLKSIESITDFISRLVPANITSSMKNFYEETCNELFFDKMIERQMNSFLVSYANYINNKFNRKGGIFQKPFKRIQIEDEGHLQQAIIYTNANAQKHNMVADYKKYPFSSYLLIIKNDQYYVDSKSVIEFFKGLEKFLFIHEQQVACFYTHNWPSSKLE